MSLQDLADKINEQLRTPLYGARPPFNDVFVDVVDSDGEALHVISSRPRLTDPTVPPAPRPPRAGDNLPQETFAVQFQGPAFPPQKLNRHERRRAEAIGRQKARASGKAGSPKAPSATRPDPKRGQPRQGLSVIEKIVQATVEGINQDGTYIAFLAQFKDGFAIVILDPMDEVNAEEAVRAAMAGRAENGFIGIMSPLVTKTGFEWAAQRNSARVADMDKVMQIAKDAISKKFADEQKENADGSGTPAAAQPAEPGTAPEQS